MVWMKVQPKKALLGMRSFYKTVITHLQKKLPIGDLLLRALTCLNPGEQKCQDTLQNCQVVAKEMPSIGSEKEIITGGKWVRYQEMELKQDEMELKEVTIFCKIDEYGDHFKVLPKMVKCALALSH